MPYFLKLLFFLILISGGPVIHSQDTLPPIRHYTMRHGLSQMKTTSITQDHLGYIWIGTRSGLNRFDGENIVSYTTDDGLPHDRVHDILSMADGKMAILTYKGLSFFNGKTFDNFPKDFLNPEYTIKKDQEEGIWIFSLDTTYRFHRGHYEAIQVEGAFDLVTDRTSGADHLLTHRSLIKVEQGRLVSETQGTFPFRPGQRTHSNCPSFFFSQPEQTGWQYCVMDQGQPNCFNSEIELLERYEDCVFYHVGSKHFSANSKRFKCTFNPSPFVRIVDIFQDSLGSLWLADENGFSVIQNSPFVHFPYRDLPYVWTVNQDYNHEYFAASFGYGMQRSPHGLEFKVEPEAQVKAGSPYYLATSARDDNGFLYFGHSGGLLTWDGHAFSMLWSGAPVYAVVYDSVAQVLHIGGPFGVKSLTLDGQVVHELSVASGLHTNDYIQNLSLDVAGNLWAGSYTGVSRISPEYKLLANLQNNGGLPSNGVYCALAELEGRGHWLGGDRGLMYFDFEHDRVVHVESQILKSMVKSLTYLKDGRLLIGAKDGLFLMDTEAYFNSDRVAIQPINDSHGYLGLEPGFTGFYTDHLDRIWICSASSVDVLSPNQLSRHSSSPRLVITHFNDQALPFLGEDIDTIRVNRGVADVRISCDAVGASRPLQVKFKFALDGEAFSEWQSSPDLLLNDLSHGRHDLKVVAGPTDHVEPQQVKTLRVYVDLPIHRRAWFLTVSVLLGLALLLVSLVLFLKQRMENKRYLSQLTASKYLRSRLLLSELNPHFIFNILSSIQHKVLLGNREEAAGYVVKLSKMIRNFLNASHQSHQSIDNYRENDISLEKEIDLLQSYLEFEQMKSDNHFHFEIRVSPDVNPGHTYIPPMLLQPFAENAIKHGLLLSDRIGRLTIDISYLEEALVIVVSDNGVGREKAKELKGDRTGHVSLGSLIIDQRIELLNELGYDLEVETVDLQPHGTQVTLTFNE